VFLSKGYITERNSVVPLLLCKAAVIRASIVKKLRSLCDRCRILFRPSRLDLRSHNSHPHLSWAKHGDPYDLPCWSSPDKLCRTCLFRSPRISMLHPQLLTVLHKLPSLWNCSIVVWLRTDSRCCRTEEYWKVWWILKYLPFARLFEPLCFQLVLERTMLLINSQSLERP